MFDSWKDAGKISFVQNALLTFQVNLANSLHERGSTRFATRSLMFVELQIEHAAASNDALTDSDVAAAKLLIAEIIGLMTPAI